MKQLGWSLVRLSALRLDFESGYCWDSKLEISMDSLLELWLGLKLVKLLENPLVLQLGTQLVLQGLRMLSHRQIAEVHCSQHHLFAQELL